MEIAMKSQKKAVEIPLSTIPRSSGVPKVLRRFGQGA
jgi:hypothetical protein